MTLLCKPLATRMLEWISRSESELEDSWNLQLGALQLLGDALLEDRQCFVLFYCFSSCSLSPWALQWSPCSLGSVRGREGNPGSAGCAVPAGSKLRAPRGRSGSRGCSIHTGREVSIARCIQVTVSFVFLSLFKKDLLVSTIQGFVFCWEGHYMPESVQECAFLVVTEAVVIVVLGADCSPSLLGWVMMPMLLLQSLSWASGVSTRSDFQLWFFLQITRINTPYFCFSHTKQIR